MKRHKYLYLHAFVALSLLLSASQTRAESSVDHVSAHSHPAHSAPQSQVIKTPSPTSSQTSSLPVVAHHIKAKIDPRRHRLQVVDQIDLTDLLAKQDAAKKALQFRLHAGLKPRCLNKGCEISLVDDKGEQKSSHKSEHLINDSASPQLPTELFQLKLVPDLSTVKISYAGRIYHPLQQGEHYARSFSETPGTIEKDGVYLAGSSYWIPSFGQEMIRSDLELNLPGDWDGVSQGKRTYHALMEGARLVRWQESHPQDELYLSAGPFLVDEDHFQKIKIYSYLRSKDPALSQKYLRATKQYLKMYQGLIGAYPYAKFALVENFWQTGYGMPSFTLLGPKVIRFPFILRSSYPHEILHNWWGNSVFVDPAQGNWCEGLTAYLADHLFKEIDGRGAAYRREQLQAYSDYVVAGRDFPLKNFKARHSAATQAVGYGKMLMTLHMLRRRLGDQVFIDGLRRFYQHNRFKRASFADLQAAMSAASGQDLSAFFTQWVQHPGAPIVQLHQVMRQAKARRWRVTGEIRQIQKARVYNLRVPVVISLQNQAQALVKFVEMKSRKAQFDWTFDKKVLRVDVDPDFDLMRRLDQAEIPPSLGAAFGAERATFILPHRAAQKTQQAYRDMIKTWRRDPKLKTEVRLDDDKRPLPRQGALWILGWDNDQRDFFNQHAGPGLHLPGGDKNILRMADKVLQKSATSLVVSGKDAKRPGLKLVWLAPQAQALPALTRKLPHYGKYSYLAFRGEAANNVAKGIFPVKNSPLSVQFDKADSPIALRPARSPLAQPSADFDSAQMMQDLRWLADPKRRGRGFGSPELKQSGTWIAKKFAQAGLKPAGDEAGSYYQHFSASAGEGKNQRQAILRNIVAVLPGTDPKLAGQSVVIGAHYDHLGLGWPDVHHGDKGKIHPGADDNASGMAVLLELARQLPQMIRPERSLVFVAFAGEEEGLLGSQHYAKFASPQYPADKIFAMLNIDTVGRLQKRPLMVFGCDSARQWIHIVRGAGYVSGVKTQAIAKDPGSSDQRSFIQAGIPALQLFSGPHADYHRPGDTVDKIEPESLRASAKISKEIIEYLVQKQAHLDATMAQAQPHKASASTQHKEQKPAMRKVSLGSVPDFAFQGDGVRLSGVTPASPAEKIGLKAGDILVEMDGQKIHSLRDLAEALRPHKPGDKVKLRVLRKGQSLHKSAQLVER